MKRWAIIGGIVVVAAVVVVVVLKTSGKTSFRNKLTPQEIADVVGYLVSLKGSKPVSP